MLVEGKKTRVCFLQSERHAPGTCSSMEEEGEREVGVMSPLSSSLTYASGHSLLSWKAVVQKRPLQLLQSPACAGQTSNSGEVAQLLRCRGVFPALQLEWEKSRRAQEWPLPAMEVVGPGGSRFSGSPAVRPPLQANAVAVAQPLAFPRRLLLPSHKLTSSLHANHLQQTAGFPHLLTLTFSASLLDMSLSFPR